MARFKALGIAEPVLNVCAASGAFYKNFLLDKTTNPWKGATVAGMDPIMGSMHLDVVWNTLRTWFPVSTPSSGASMVKVPDPPFPRPAQSDAKWRWHPVDGPLEWGSKRPTPQGLKQSIEAVFFALQHIDGLVEKTACEKTGLNYTTFNWEKNHGDEATQAIYDEMRERYPKAALKLKSKSKPKSKSKGKKEK